MRTSAPAGSSSKTISASPCSPKLVTRLWADGAPDVENMLFAVPLVVTKPPPQSDVMNSIFKSSTRDFAKSMMRRTPS